MRARRPGHCGLCDDSIITYEEISKWLGSWVHESCKANELARKLAGGSTVVLPDVDANKVRPHLPRDGVKVKRGGKVSVKSQTKIALG